MKPVASDICSTFSIHVYLVERRTGTIVNISSIAGRKTLPDHAVYCGTKFAVHAFTEQIREEVAQYDVRLVNIAPGVVETELLSHSTDKKIVDDYKVWKANMGRMRPAHRAGARRRSSRPEMPVPEEMKRQVGLNMLRDSNSIFKRNVPE